MHSDKTLTTQINFSPNYTADGSSLIRLGDKSTKRIKNEAKIKNQSTFYNQQNNYKLLKIFSS